MKYDVDLQEIDAIRRARNVYEEESAPSGGRKREKECSVAGKRRGEKKRKRKKRAGEGGGRKYTRAIIMLPMPRAGAVCLEL